MKTVSGLLLLLVGGVTATAATSHAPSTASKSVPGAPPAALNVVVILDLSDRIDPIRHPGQAAQDLKVLDGLVTLFEESVRKGLYLLSKDRLAFAVAPQATAYQGELMELADRLRISMPDLNATGTERGKPGFDRARADLTNGLNRLYSSAVASTNYVGADIWSFFRDRLDSYLSTEPGVQDVVIVVTDGYINFDAKIERARPRRGPRTSFMQVASLRGEPGWEGRFDREDLGLISFGPRYQHVNMIVTGLRYVDLNDQPIVERYWRKWLSEMGVARVRLLPADDSAAQAREALRRSLY